MKPANKKVVKSRPSKFGSPVVTIKGSAKAGWILSVIGRDLFAADIALTGEELEVLKVKLNQKKKWI